MKEGEEAMFKIENFAVETYPGHVVTDKPKPFFSFYYVSDDRSVIERAVISLNNGWKKEIGNDVSAFYDGEPLKPFTEYTVTLHAYSDKGEEAVSSVSFETGRLSVPWEGKWITDGSYCFKEKKVSPKVMVFEKDVEISKEIESAKIYVTALGLYKLELNKKKVGDRFLTPGFTSYRYNLMYQIYDVKDSLKPGKNTLVAHVAGGWAVGSYVFTRVNRYYAKRQALLLELRIRYKDGSEEVVKSDPSFRVSTEGPYRMADLYDGETYDANVTEIEYHPASLENVKLHPDILADYGNPVRVNRIMKPEILKTEENETIYDFKQNFAGVIHLRIKKAIKGQKIVVRHAEVLNQEGELDVSLLRTAKATLTYICKEGEQIHTPEFTYMGFRYVSVSGIRPEDVDVEGYVLMSDVKETGSFHCSNEMLNRLDSNIRWSSRSNFMDIPTDCPQRDERMGWTGDIAIFAPTAIHNFEMRRFLRKWLMDVKDEQLRTGGLPNTVPSHGYGFPATMPKMAIDFWGDAIIDVPYALYMAYGDEDIVRQLYPNMKKYVDACRFWAGIWGVGKYRYIWHTPSVFHFGDWVAPDVDKMSVWQKRSKYTATASLRKTSKKLSEIAAMLGYEKDANYYERLSDKVARAYVDVFTDHHGRLKKEQFQTGYVLPLAFKMFDEEETREAMKNLVHLIEEKDYCIGTGFPGTGYILYVLADNGHADTVYKMLLNTKAPSWLYNVSVGGTTIWEKFDGMLPDGTARKSTDGTGNMISFNHYASGSVGNFLYTRLGGVRIVEPGYKKFKVKPVLGGGITSCETSTLTPYGKINVRWKIEGDKFSIHVDVPMTTSCVLELPDGERFNLAYGGHTLTCSLKA